MSIFFSKPTEPKELRGYFMRHKSGGDVGFSWDAKDSRFDDQWERIPAVPEVALTDEITPADRYNYLARQVMTIDHDGGWSGSYSFPMIDRHSGSTYNGAKPFMYKTLDEAIDVKIRVSRSKDKK